MPLKRRPVSPQAQHLAQMKILRMATNKLTRAAQAKGLPQERTAKGEELVRGMASKISAFGGRLPEEIKEQARSEKTRLYGLTIWGRKSKSDYGKSTKGKAIRRAYKQTVKGKEADVRYEESEKGKAAARARRKRYLQSEKGKAAKKKYRQTGKGREIYLAGKRRYQQSKKGKATVRERYKKQKDLKRRELLEAIMDIVDIRHLLDQLASGRIMPRAQDLKTILTVVLPEKTVSEVLKKVLPTRVREADLTQIMQALKESELVYRLDLTDENFTFIKGTLQRCITIASNPVVERILIGINNEIREQYIKSKQK